MISLRMNKKKCNKEGTPRREKCSFFLSAGTETSGHGHAVINT